LVSHYFFFFVVVVVDTKEEQHSLSTTSSQQEYIQEQHNKMGRSSREQEQAVAEADVEIESSSSSLDVSEDAASASSSSSIVVPNEAHILSAKYLERRGSKVRVFPVDCIDIVLRMCVLNDMRGVSYHANTFTYITFI
jgi:hypothetical protein